MSRKQHVHKYELRPTTTLPVWCCAAPTCNHFMPNHLESILPGRSSICWECNQPFALSKINMKAKRPICDVCRGTIDDLGRINPLNLPTDNGPVTRVIKTIPEPPDEVIDYSAEHDKIPETVENLDLITKLVNEKLK